MFIQQNQPAVVILLYPIELNTFSISPWLHSLFIKHNLMPTAHSQLGSSFTQTGATTSARNGYNWGPAECKLLMFPICRCRHCTWSNADTSVSEHVAGRLIKLWQMSAEIVTFTDAQSTPDPHTHTHTTWCDQDNLFVWLRRGEFQDEDH